MFEDILKLIDGSVDGLFDKELPTTPRFAFGALKLDVQDTEKAYLIHADMPGYEKEDISIDLKDGVLNISAEKKSNTETKENGYIRRERFHGNVHRSVYVGEDVTVEDVKAKLDKGILTITIPKKEEVKPETKKIVIE